MIGSHFARIVLLFWLFGAGLAQATSTEPSVRELLEGSATVQLHDDPDELFDPIAVRRFYEERGFAPAWTGPGCQAALQSLVGAIENSESHGLQARDYHLDGLLGPDRCDATRELLATDAWLALAAHLHAGRVDPLTVEPDWTATRPSIDAVALLGQALAAGDVAGALERLAPSDPLYAELRKTLARFRGYAARSRWVGIESGPTLRLGDSGIRVEQLRARLLLSGLLEAEPAAASEAAFDISVEDAVRTFQRRANLEPDGVVFIRSSSASSIGARPASRARSPISFSARGGKCPIRWRCATSCRCSSATRVPWRGSAMSWSIAMAASLIRLASTGKRCHQAISRIDCASDRVR